MKESVRLSDKTFHKYLPTEKIAGAIKVLAASINQDYAGKNPLLVGILDGSFIFLSDLVRQISIPVEISFVSLKSYVGTTSSGTVREVLPFSVDISNRDVLIVEDIIDTGATLKYFLDRLNLQSPRSVSVVTLLLKEEVFKNKFPVRYFGIKIPDKFVVGFGMDYEGRGRQLPDIYVIED